MLLLQNGNEINYLAEGKSNKIEEKQQLLLLGRFPGNGAKNMVGSSIVAIMLQLLELPISNFINPVVRNKLGSDGAVCTSTSSCRSCHLVSWHKSARAQANFYMISEEAF